jgi:membrane-associated phospholipid phosphatase
MVAVVGTRSAAGQMPGAALRPSLAAAPIDSVPTGERQVPWLRRPEAVASVGAVLAAAAIDGAVRHEAQDARSSTSNQLADFGNAAGNFRYVGPTLGVVWLAGTIAGRRDLAQASVRAAAAGLLAGGVTGVLKFGFGRVRPSEGGTPGSFRPLSGFMSFPSGHATVATAVATSLAHATPDGWSDLFFYGGAAVAGFARINHDKHWFSDVIAGSIVGYLVGRQVTLRHPRLRPVVGPEVVGVAIDF